MKKNSIKDIIYELDTRYPYAKPSLTYKTPFELVIAVMLSAQCTDKRVNEVTKVLFREYNTPEKLYNLSINKIEEYIKPCGFYHNKAKHIKEISRSILYDFGGQVPNTIEELMSLSGIGKKSANVIMTDAFNTPVGIAVDTHVKRISTRLGLTKNTDPLKIEEDLLKIVPHDLIGRVNHLFIFHGRECCRAQNPKCNVCPIKNYCDFFE